MEFLTGEIERRCVQRHTESHDQGRISTHIVGLKLFVRHHKGCLCGWSTTVTAHQSMLTDTMAVTTGLQYMCPTLVFSFCSRACLACCRSHSFCVCVCVFLRLVPGPHAASCGYEGGPSAATPCEWVEKLTGAFFAVHLQSMSNTMSMFETPLPSAPVFRRTPFSGDVPCRPRHRANPPRESHHFMDTLAPTQPTDTAPQQSRTTQLTFHESNPE